MNAMKRAAAAISLGTIFAASTALAQNGSHDIGSVDTAVTLLGPNHKIKIAAFPDPSVDGVTCFVSRAVTGGLAGGLGVATDPSDASIACRQTGPIHYRAPINGSQAGEEVFNEKRSAFFKTLHVQRFFDRASSSLVYLTFSDKLVDGSPKNSLSAVTPENWNGAAPDTPRLR